MARGTTARMTVAIVGAALAVTLVGCGQDQQADNQPAGNAIDRAPTETQAPAAQPPANTSATPPQPSQSGTTTTEPPAQPTTTSADDQVCTSATLDVSLGRGEGAAGTVYKPLRLTNAGDHACTIHGFPGVSYVAGDNGEQVGAAAYREGDKGEPITLDPGQTASSDVGMVNVGNYDPADCQPQPVRGLRVYPPHDTASMFVEYQRTGCANANISGHQLTVDTMTADGDQ